MVDLKNYTSIKIGGQARDLFIVHDKQDLIRIIRKHKADLYILGAGSNLLIKDGILSRVVIKLGDEFSYARRSGEELEAGAAVPFALLLKLACENNFGGLEKLAGIPAGLGGMLVMNASAFGQEISAFLVKVEVCSLAGEILILTKDELVFGYRYSSLKNYIVLRAWFRLKADNTAAEAAEVYFKSRCLKQEFSYPNCGCIFKNSALGSSGLLIEQCGLKGASKNDAQISLNHANFIINRGAASYDDVDYLINLVKDKVYQKYDVFLEEEIVRWM